MITISSRFFAIPQHQARLNLFRSSNLSGVPLRSSLSLRVPLLSRGLAMSSITSPDQLPSIADYYADGTLSMDGVESDCKADEKLNKKVVIWRGDITKLKSDMIVNAANSSLLGGGGVDGAIHRAAGQRAFLEECRKLGGAKTGETKVTNGYDLPAKFVAHTVGPVYDRYEPDEAERLLQSCYQTSLERCVEYKGKSIGFSSISTGVYGYPIEDATHVVLDTTRTFLENNQGKEGELEKVVYVVFSERDEKVYKKLAPIYFPAESK